MLGLRTLFRLSKERRSRKYLNKCPFCSERKLLAKDWGRFPNHRLTNRVRAAKPLFLALTDQAEQEWFDYIVCFRCYRIIWHSLNPHGADYEIPLPSIEKLTGWKKLPHTPVIIYDTEGNPVYGTKRSKEMYR